MVKKNNDYSSTHTDAHDAHNNACVCSSASGLFVPNRELSYCVAGGILGLFFVFMAGFFWGQQYAIKDFLHKLDQDSFSDQVASSLYVLTNKSSDLQDSDQENEDVDAEGDSSEEDNESAGDNVIDTIVIENMSGEASESIDDTEGTQNSDQDSKSIASHGISQSSNQKSNCYMAQLIGFGTEQAAYQFVNRITKKGFSAKVEKRKSRTAKGKTLFWYQVVTDSYADKAQLEEIIAILVRQEKLKDIRILTC